MQGVIDMAAEILGDFVVQAQEVAGPIGEPVSTKEQMAAFDAMTPQDWVRLTDERGAADVVKFMREMQRRKGISDGHKQLS